MKKIPAPRRARSTRPARRAADAPPATKPAARPRGRPRSFDRDAALERAMEVFWARGFEATSIADLTEAMGINPPSLYAAFGDKESLFLEAIDRYERVRTCPYAEEPTARGAIQRLLTYLAQELACPEHPRGCLMVLAASTTSAAPRLQEKVAQRRAEARGRLKARIEKGIADGDVPAEADVAGLADFYATIIKGMSLSARDGASRDSLLATVERAMSVFPPPPARPAGRRKARRVSEPA
jgi:AcrR family transcriptional regulator